MAELASEAEVVLDTAPVDSAAEPMDVIAPPFQAGPVSRLLSWLRQSPTRLWFVTLVVTLACVAWPHAVLWATGRLAPWTVDLNYVVLVAYVAYWFPAAALLVHLGRGAIRAFWPATGWPEIQQAVWLYRFEKMPIRVELAALAVGFAVAFGAIVYAPAAIVGPEEGRIASFIALTPTFALGYMLNAVGTVFVVRALSLIVEIHEKATNINPFDRVPIYAFSRVTTYVGLLIVAATYYTLTVNTPFISGNLPALLMLPVTAVIGLAAFVLPLWGIHQRLARTKEALLEDADRRMTAVGAEVYDRVDAREFEGLKDVNESLTALTTLRERIRHLPTWPWPPQLLRGFISALLLPIIIYLITRLIAAVVPG